jgi:hypothetical protein
MILSLSPDNKLSLIKYTIEEAPSTVAKFDVLALLAENVNQFDYAIFEILN